jgi:hypothetical protein
MGMCGLLSVRACVGLCLEIDVIVISAYSVLRNTCIPKRTDVMKRNWLTQLERVYVQSLLDEAIRHVKMRDRQSCIAFVQHAIKSGRMSTSMLSQDVINKFAKDGRRLLQPMLHHHAGYKNLPCPLKPKG